MERPFINRLRIQNYGCIKDATFELTPLHALIGPNDSGKSTVLRALRTITTWATRPLSDLGEEGARLQKAFLEEHRGGRPLVRATVGDASWEVGTTGAHRTERLFSDRQPLAQTNFNLGLGVDESLIRSEAILPALRKAVRGSQLLRLEADALRGSSGLIREGHKLQLLDTRGRGLPAIYDAIVTRDLDAYVALGKRFATLFPSVKGLSLKNPTESTKALGIILHDKTEVSADFMSEGMLYYLAYAATPYLEPTAVLLVEEPENGLHPARIKEVVGILRELSKTTQVVIATHSPLVINELQPEEVTVVRRKPDEGTTARLLKDTPNFAERSKVYALGELWLSYADGDFEEPLFKEPEATPDPGEPVDWSEPRR